MAKYLRSVLIYSKLEKNNGASPRQSGERGRVWWMGVGGHIHVGVCAGENVTLGGCYIAILVLPRVTSAHKTSTQISGKLN